jgi:hypothetical protein
MAAGASNAGKCNCETKSTPRQDEKMSYGVALQQRPSSKRASIAQTTVKHYNISICLLIASIGFLHSLLAAYTSLVTASPHLHSIIAFPYRHYRNGISDNNATTYVTVAISTREKSTWSTSLRAGTSLPVWNAMQKAK